MSNILDKISKSMIRRICNYIDIFPTKCRCEFVYGAYGYGDAPCNKLVEVNHKDLTSKHIICNECKSFYESHPKCINTELNTYEKRMKWINNYHKEKEKQLRALTRKNITLYDVIRLRNIITSDYDKINIRISNDYTVDPFIYHFVTNTYDADIYYRYYQLTLIKEIGDMVNKYIDESGRTYEPVLDVYSKPDIYPVMLLDIQIYFD